MPKRTPRDLADRMAGQRRVAKADDGYARETFTPARRPSSPDGERVPDEVPQGSLHDKSKSGENCRPDRVHDEAVMVGGLKTAFQPSGYSIVSKRPETRNSHQLYRTTSLPA